MASLTDWVLFIVSLMSCLNTGFSHISSFFANLISLVMSSIFMWIFPDTGVGQGRLCTILMLLFQEASSLEDPALKISQHCEPVKRQL